MCELNMSLVVFVVMLYQFPSDKGETFVLRSYVTFELGAVVRTQIGFPPIPPVHKHTVLGSLGEERVKFETQKSKQRLDVVQMNCTLESRQIY